MNEKQPTGLICKPAYHPGVTELLFTVYYPTFQALVSIRSLDLPTDLDLIHRWVNQPYAKRFWQMNGPRDLLAKTYQSVLASPHGHAFIGLINHQPAFQIDAYGLGEDELKNHIGVGDGDAGLHLLMAPPRELKKNWSLAALKAFQEFYFSFPATERLFAEPDRENIAANRLSVKAGFEFLGEIKMSYKTASLYCLSRSHFQILHSSSPLNNI